MLVRPANPRHQRRGAMALELLLVLPILLTMLFGMAEISLLLTARQQLVVASRQGARVAAQGGSAADVESAVTASLGSGRIAGATVTSHLTGADGQPLPSGSDVTVAVSVPVGQAVPDLLAFAGISFRNQQLAAQSTFRKE